METPQGGQSSPITGNVLFYKKPEPLNHNAHAGLGVKQIDKPFEFLRSAHAVPLTTSEFGMAASCYPIIFVGDDHTPVAVMGVRQGQNLFVDENGRTAQDQYVPAFVRRYPFVFANDSGQDQLLLCVDREAPMVSEAPDVAFFEGDQPSKFTQDAIEFCKEFERQRRSTEMFREIMKEHDLFEEKSISFQPRDAQGNEAGDPQKVADYWAVSEERLNELPIEAFQKIRDTGALSVIYSHLISLMLWPRIINMALRMPADGGNA